MKYDFDPSLALLDFETPLKPFYDELVKLKNGDENQNGALAEVKKKILQESKKVYKTLNNWQLTQIARHPNRPYALDYINVIFNDYTEMHGDRNYGDDLSIVCGMGNIEDFSVVFIAQQKGRSTDENVKRNFGMPRPEAYRKAMRFFEFAQKFKKPVISFIDTPGAFPGIEGEERSQGEAIARNLKVMAGLKTPIVSVVIGEGGSGGALGIGLANYVMMLEYAIYSVISPESCASILWRDANEKEKAAKALKNDAKTAMKFGVIDEIIGEPIGAAHRNSSLMASSVKNSLLNALVREVAKSPETLVKERMEKYSKMGDFVR